MFERIKNIVVVTGVCLTAVQCHAKTDAQCRIADAHYVLKADLHYSADFVPVKLLAGTTNIAAVALHIRSTAGLGNNTKDFWLGIEQGNGYSYGETYVIDNPALHDGRAVARQGTPSDNKTTGMPNMPLLTASATEISSAVPSAPSDLAPQRFVIPYLGMNLWYANQHFSDKFNESNREMMPLGFFELSSCDVPKK